MIENICLNYFCKNGWVFIQLKQYVSRLPIFIYKFLLVDIFYIKVVPIFLVNVLL